MVEEEYEWYDCLGVFSSEERARIMIASMDDREKKYYIQKFTLDDFNWSEERPEDILYVDAGVPSDLPIDNDFLLQVHQVRSARKMTNAPLADDDEKQTADPFESLYAEVTTKSYLDEIHKILDRVPGLVREAAMSKKTSIVVWLADYGITKLSKGARGELIKALKPFKVWGCEQGPFVIKW